MTRVSPSKAEKVRRAIHQARLNKRDERQRGLQPTATAPSACKYSTVVFLAYALLLRCPASSFPLALVLLLLLEEEERGIFRWSCQIEKHDAVTATATATATATTWALLKCSSILLVSLPEVSNKGESCIDDWDMTDKKRKR